MHESFEFIFKTWILDQRDNNRYKRSLQCMESVSLDEHSDWFIAAATGITNHVGYYFQSLKLI